MKSVSTQYTGLVRERGVIFPDFLRQQDETARDLYQTLSPLITAGSLNTIVDIGCGTGEILSSLAGFIERDRPHLDSKVFLCGLDANRKSIVEARRLHADGARPLTRLEFHISKHDALLFDEIGAWIAPNENAYAKMAVICSGHTFFHLQYLPLLFDHLRSSRAERPTMWIVDVYYCWDRILRQIQQGEHLEKRAERLKPDGQKLEYVLFSRKSIENADRLERGLYELSTRAQRARREIISTVQWAWSETELIAQFATAGYSVTKRGMVESGYGRMIRIVFSLSAV